MENIPGTCATIKTVRSFCDCLAGVESVDAAVQTFCDRVATGDLSITGDDLAELKQALKDME